MNTKKLQKEGSNQLGQQGERGLPEGAFYDHQRSARDGKQPKNLFEIAEDPMK